MSSHLDPHDRNELVSTLQRRARELREEIRATLAKSDDEAYVNVANEVRDLEDESFADLVVDVNLAEIDRDLAELRAVEAALRALHEGRYGSCEDCGRPIDLERLQVAPHATRCINCQTTWERTHYQRIGHTL
ncbi:MAG: TraR/DksA family transcriptional regulator [Steroidobacteraceae bacterium]